MTDKNEVLELAKTCGASWWANNMIVSFKAEELLAFASAIEQKYLARIAMLRNTLEAARSGVLWYIENSDDANSSDEEMLEQIESALDRTQQDTDAFIAGVKAEALEEAAEHFKGQRTDSCPGTKIDDGLRRMAEELRNSAVQPEGKKG